MKKSAKGTKTSSRHERQQGMHQQKDCSNFTPYSFVGSVTPWSWPYPCYYSPADFSNMYMQPYMIQYPTSYPSYGALPRPVALDSNLVKNNVHIAKRQREYNNKQQSKDIQPRWCPSGLSRTQKRRLQRLRKQGAIEQQIEEKPAKPMRTRKEWRPKQADATLT